MRSVKSKLALIVLAAIISTFCCSTAHAEKNGLRNADLDRIGKRIWKNECDGTVDGLTSWNTGENFASLGIGHFIWYIKGEEGPFEESFPKLVAWFQQNGVPLPQWLQGEKHCPWTSRAAFLKDHDGERQRDLRKLLASTVREQTLFIIHRLHEATPKFREAAGTAGRHVEQNIAALGHSAEGNFAMIDYVNFKGEGLNPRERYNGQGWGLLQVLIEMKPSNADDAASNFASASKRVLSRRVQNSPPERGEKRWLEGWHNRCAAYAK
jgi:hypothetical protein